MDELIIQVLSGSATPSQEERVRKWRAESADNEAYFRSTDGVWRATEPTVRSHLGSPVDPAVILAAAEERRRGGAADTIPLASRRTATGWRSGALRWSLAAAAAVVAVALGIRTGAPDGTLEPMATYVAQAGAARLVNLDDGSFVRLAAGSSLQVWEDESQRSVTLDGRAFFAVARDETLPFVVRAGASEIRVLGTRFEVSDQGSDVRTVVVDGRVAVSNEHGAVEVTGGSVARAAVEGPPTVDVPDDIYALLDWPGGILLFQGTPMAQVAEEVGRYFDRTVEVRGDRLPSLRISGSFEGAGFEEVVLALCDAAGARCSFTDSGALIQPIP